jgi:hypothetical protein
MAPTPAAAAARREEARPPAAGLDRLMTSSQVRDATLKSAPPRPVQP